MLLYVLFTSIIHVRSIQCNNIMHRTVLIKPVSILSCTSEQKKTVLIPFIYCRLRKIEHIFDPFSIITIITALLVARPKYHPERDKHGKKIMTAVNEMSAKLNSWSSEKKPFLKWQSFIFWREKRKLNKYPVHCEMQEQQKNDPLPMETMCIILTDEALPIIRFQLIIQFNSY